MEVYFVQLSFLFPFFILYLLLARLQAAGQITDEISVVSLSAYLYG